MPLQRKTECNNRANVRRQLQVCLENPPAKERNSEFSAIQLTKKEFPIGQKSKKRERELYLRYRGFHRFLMPFDIPSRTF